MLTDSNQPGTEGLRKQPCYWLLQSSYWRQTASKVSTRVRVRVRFRVGFLTVPHTKPASSPGHSQILSRSCGEKSGEDFSNFLHTYEIKTGSGLRTRLIPDIETTIPLPMFGLRCCFFSPSLHTFLRLHLHRPASLHPQVYPAGTHVATTHLLHCFVFEKCVASK